mmetsp:Transcript_24699/g.44671  ORF Transcript_24699/g.44671 Transcript_24699/m.44671 type:complete len:235 (-) Transcript_24699:121-825(-)
MLSLELWRVKDWNSRVSFHVPVYKLCFCQSRVGASFLGFSSAFKIHIMNKLIVLYKGLRLFRCSTEQAYSFLSLTARCIKELSFGRNNLVSKRTTIVGTLELACKWVNRRTSHEAIAKVACLADCFAKCGRCNTNISMLHISHLLHFLVHLNSILIVHVKERHGSRFTLRPHDIGTCARRRVRLIDFFKIHVRRSPRCRHLKDWMSHDTIIGCLGQGGRTKSRSKVEHSARLCR